MAPTICKSCRAQVITNSKFCPRCGNWLKSPMHHALWGLGACLAVLITIISSTKPAPGPNLSSSPAASAQAAEAAPKPNPKLEAMSLVDLKFTWSKAGFGNIMEANFTVSNDSDYAIKDLEVTCVHAANSGTRIDKNTRTIYEIVKAHSKRRFPKFSMGFINNQVATSNCGITDLTVVE